MENQHFEGTSSISTATFNSYVSLPESLSWVSHGYLYFVDSGKSGNETFGDGLTRSFICRDCRLPRLVVRACMFTVYTAYTWKGRIINTKCKRYIRLVEIVIYVVGIG